MSDDRSESEAVALRRSFDRRGHQLVEQRLRFTDALADLARENEELRGRAERAENSVRDLHEALVAAHRQLDEEHASLSFRVAHRMSGIYRRVLRK